MTNNGFYGSVFAGAILLVFVGWGVYELISYLVYRRKHRHDREEQQLQDLFNTYIACRSKRFRVHGANQDGKDIVLVDFPTMGLAKEYVREHGEAGLEQLISQKSAGRKLASKKRKAKTDARLKAAASLAIQSARIKGFDSL